MYLTIYIVQSVRRVAAGAADTPPPWPSLSLVQLNTVVGFVSSGCVLIL